MPTDQDPAKAFETHAHYVDAITQCLGYTSPAVWDSALTSIRDDVDNFLGAVPPISPKKSFDFDQISLSLRSAWGTELILLQQLSLVEQANEMARVAAGWVAVQAYYTGYHATQALIVAEGRSRPQNHPSTQTQFGVCWGGRSGNLAPWTMQYSHQGHHGCASAVDDSLSNLSGPNILNCYDLTGKALRTTWEQAQKDRRRRAAEQKLKTDKKAFAAAQAERLAAGKKALVIPAWHNQLRRNLSPAERSAVDSGIGPYSLLHYMFRLRIKANYVDGDVFSVGPASAWNGVRFVADLTFLASALATAHEQRVRHQIGTDLVYDWQSEWLHGAGSAMAGQGTTSPNRM